MYVLVACHRGVHVYTAHAGMRMGTRQAALDQPYDRVAYRAPNVNSTMSD